MVTGDLNAVLVEWVVQYHIDDPKLFLFKVHEPELTLRDLSEAVIKTSSGSTVLDLAALDILNRASPFDALPPEITAEYDDLVFEYKFLFADQLRSGSP